MCALVDRLELSKRATGCARVTMLLPADSFDQVHPLLRRLPEKMIPDCAGFLFGFKARQQAHSELCNGWGNAEAGHKDQQDGIFFDRNRLSPPGLKM